MNYPYERCRRHDCQREEACKQGALCPVKIDDQRKAKGK